MSSENTNLVVLTEQEDKRPEVVRAMTPKQLSMLNNWLSRGEKPWKIAQKVQKDWKLGTHVTTQAVMGQIMTYQKRYQLQAVQETTTTLNPETGTTVTTTKTKHMVSKFLKGRLDAYHLNEQMVQLQIRRVNKIVEREDKMPTLLDAARKELELLMKMMQNFTNLQFELGIIQRTAHVLEHHFTLENPDLLTEEQRVANKLKAIQGRDVILGRVRNVLDMVSRMEEENRDAIEAEVVALERGEDV